MTDFDLHQRPETYWPDELTLEQRVGRIKGLVRRRRAQELLKAGELSPDDPVLTPTLADDDREARSAMHPLMMGGEYLPDVDADEVEIARIELLSTTGDTFSIRARREDELAYRMVDEYSNDYDLGSSTGPLTLGELIERLDATEVGYSDMGVPTTIPECFLGWNAQINDTVEGLSGFVTVTSPFYDDLEAYYRDRSDRFLDEWAEEHA